MRTLLKLKIVRVFQSICALLLLANLASPAVAARLTASTTALYGDNGQNTALSCTAGQPCVLWGVVSPTGASGTVTLKSGTTTIGTTPTYLADNGFGTLHTEFKLTYTFQSVGTPSVTATYGGDSKYAASTSSAITVNVRQLACTVEFVGYSNYDQSALMVRPGSAVRLPVSVRPTLAGGLPCKGTLILKDGATTVASRSLDAVPDINLGRGFEKITTIDVPVDAIGTHSFVASYSGDISHSAASNAPLTVKALSSTTERTDFFAQVVNATYFDGVTLSPQFSSPESFSGSGFEVCAQPQDASQLPICASALWDGPVGPNGTALYGVNLVTAGVGSQQYQFVYREWESTDGFHYGGAPFQYSVLSVPVVVAPSPTKLQLWIDSPNVSVNQQLVFHFTASTVAGRPLPATETISLRDSNNNSLGQFAANACQSSCVVTMPMAGSFSLKLVYFGKTDAQGASLAVGSESASVPVTVSQTTSTTSLAFSSQVAELGQPVSLIATVTGNNPTGAVTFRDGGVSLGTASLNTSRQASLNATFNSLGDHLITAEYFGDAGNAASASSALPVTIQKRSATVAVSASPATVTLGTNVQIAATVTGFSPTGTVTFYDGGAQIGTRDVMGGLATLVLPIAGASGTHAITATYSGDSNNSGASSAVANVLAQDDTPKMRWRFQYDADGSLTRVEEPNGKGTDIFYNELKQPISRQLPLAGAVVGTTFDKRGNLASLTDPRNLTTTVTVNGLGDKKAVSSPDAGSKSATYDSAGNLATSTDARGKTTTFGYDAGNRLTSISYPTGTGTTFEYDGGATPVAPNIGRMTKMTDESGTSSFTFSIDGWVLSKTQLTNGKTLANVYNYGTSGPSNGKLTELTYPGKARVNYGYDGFGRVTVIQVNPVNSAGTATDLANQTTILSSVTYSPTGQVTGWTWGDGTPYVVTYDEFGQTVGYPLGKENGSGTAAGTRRTLTYDDAGRITQMSHVNNGASQAALNQGFVYDDLGRLTQATVGSSTSYGYGYDLGDNRFRLTVGGTNYTQTVALTSNRLTQSIDASGTRNYTFDAAGNVLSDGTATYAYGDRGRMVSATVGSNVVAYKYNGFEQRVSKTGPTSLVPTGAAYYAYDEAGQVLGEYDGTLLPAYETVYLGNAPVAVIKYAKSGNKTVTWANTFSYVYADHLGTPRVIVRSTDHAIQWRWDTAEPFGATVPNSNPGGLGAFTFNQRFPGQVYDSETSNFYNWNRDYSSRLGRYVQSDPIGLAGGTNTYGYVGGNPVAKVDPSGTIGQAIPMIIPGLAIGCALSQGCRDLIGDVLRRGVESCKKGVDRMFSENKGDKGEEAASSEEGNKLPDDRLLAGPKDRGNAPIGDDGFPVELHHRGQQEDSPLDEMTRTDHRGKGNFSKNHDNTGNDKSNIDRGAFDKARREYWAKEWDRGRFDRIPK